MKRFLITYATVAVLSAGATVSQAQQANHLPVDADNCAIMAALSLTLPTSCMEQNNIGQSRGIVVRLNNALKETNKTPTSVKRVALAPTTTKTDVTPISSSKFDRSAAKSDSGYYIQFAFDSDRLEADYQAHLDRLSVVLKGAAMINSCLRVTGHTDTSGSDLYNKKLAEKRAIMVASYLHSSGDIAADRIAISSEGEAAPLPDIHGHDPLNRRVEFQTKESTGGC